MGREGVSEMIFFYGFFLGLVVGSLFSFWTLKRDLRKAAKAIINLERRNQKCLARWRVLNARFDASINASKLRIGD
jgi:hypothetical protein